MEISVISAALMSEMNIWDLAENSAIGGIRICGLQEARCIHCKRASFGIGTNLTNDVGLKPMNIVLKLIAVSEPDLPWTNVVKLSDEKGKHTGDPKMIRLAKESGLVVAEFSEGAVLSGD